MGNSNRANGALFAYLQFFLPVPWFSFVLLGLLKEVISNRRPDNLDGLLSRIHLQFTLGLLWAYTALLNANSLAAWLRNLSFASQLNPDPSLAPAVALSASLVMTWATEDGGAPRMVKFYDRISGLLQFLAVLVVLYGSVSIYRVNYFVCLAFTALSLHQVAAPKRNLEEEAAEQAGKIENRSGQGIELHQ